MGDDDYVVQTSTDVITEATGEGMDEVKSTVTYTLGDNLETLTLTGTDDIDGTGNALNNVITGNSANNALYGGEGEDELSAGEGDDMLDGGDGEDGLNGEGGNDTLYGGFGYDAMSGGDGNDLFYAGDDQDDLWGNFGDDTLYGGEGNDTLRAGDGNDRLFGDDGPDMICGHSANDVLYGGEGGDTLHGGLGDDALYGGAGNDILMSRYGFDSMSGGDGDDFYLVNSPLDQVIETGSSGHDTVYSFANFTLGTGVEDLTLTGTRARAAGGNDLNNTLVGNTGDNEICGLVGADTLYGSDGNDRLFGGEGNDHLDGGAGADRLVGNSGDDLFLVDNAADLCVELINEGADLVQASVSYMLGPNIEALELIGTASINGFGNGRDNRLTGNGAANVLIGFSGNDTLVGGDGADQLAGGAGNDVLTGGDDADRFVFDRVLGFDHITDFVSGVDQIQFAANLVGALGGTNALQEGSFYAAYDAVSGQDVDDRLIFNTSTGALYYDVDGSGAKAAVQIAVLEGLGNVVPGLGFSDFIF